jgi:triphosphoribosyl-dephospho-CoA synthetase
MPRVLTDIELLQHDALAMRAAMADAQQTLDAVDGPTDAALRTLAELDRVKSRMQAWSVLSACCFLTTVPDA